MKLLFADDFSVGGDGGSLLGRVSTSGHQWEVDSIEKSGYILAAPPGTGLRALMYYYLGGGEQISADPPRSVDAKVPSVLIDTSKPIRMEYSMTYDGVYAYWEREWQLPLHITTDNLSGLSVQVAPAISSTWSVSTSLPSPYISEVGTNAGGGVMTRSEVVIEWDGISAMSVTVNGQTPIIGNFEFAPDELFIIPKLFRQEPDSMSGTKFEYLRMYGTRYSATPITFWKDKIKCREVT